MASGNSPTMSASKCQLKFQPWCVDCKQRMAHPSYDDLGSAPGSCANQSIRSVKLWRPLDIDCYLQCVLVLLTRCRHLSSPIRLHVMPSCLPVSCPCSPLLPVFAPVNDFPLSTYHYQHTQTVISIDSKHMRTENPNWPHSCLLFAQLPAYRPLTKQLLH